MVGVMIYRFECCGREWDEIKSYEERDSVLCQTCGKKALRYAIHPGQKMEVTEGIMMTNPSGANVHF